MVECSCGTHGHMLVLEYDDEFGGAVYMQMNTHLGFWGRLKSAVRYVFDKEGPHHWHETLVNKDNFKEFKAWVEEIEKKGFGEIWESEV